MNIKDEILLRIPYGYSKRKIVDDLIQKDFSREKIYIVSLNLFILH